jgi:FG-GAP repeat protein
MKAKLILGAVIGIIIILIAANVNIVSGLNTTTVTYTIDGSTSEYGLGMSIQYLGDNDGNNTDEVVCRRDQDPTVYDVVILEKPSTGSIFSIKQNIDGNDIGFGSSIATGDFDGDTYIELAIGDPLYDSGGSNLIGRVRIYDWNTSEENFEHAKDIYLSDFSNSPFNGADQAGSKFGEDLGVTDANGDGCDDLLIGAPSWKHSSSSSGPADSGLACLVEGNSVVSGSSHILWADHYVLNSANCEWGKYVSGIGDIDNDGYEDWAIVILQKTETGDQDSIVKVYLGANSPSPNYPVITNNYHGSMEASRQGGSASYYKPTGGDINGDVCSDLIIGESTTNNQVNVVIGVNSTGLDFTNNKKVISSGRSNTAFGIEVAVQIDENNDGYNDIIIVEPGRDTGGLTNCGTIWGYHGKQYPLTGAWSNSWSIDGTQNSESKGIGGVCGDDFTNDTKGDLILGSPGYDVSGQTDKGRVEIWSGN